MEVVFEQHNPFPLGLGMKQMTAAAGLHERGSSECFLPTSDRLSSKSSQLSQNLPMQNSRSAARHRRRVNASLLFTSVGENEISISMEPGAFSLGWENSTSSPPKVSWPEHQTIVAPLAW